MTSKNYCDFLFEIGTEELPFSAQKIVLENAENIFKTLLKTYNLESSLIKIFVTPTRIVLLVKDLATCQKQENEKILGPKKDSDERAILGFLKKNNAKIEDLKEISTEKGIYYFLEKILETQNTKNLLDKICNEFTAKLPFSKMMIWSETNFKFIRPIRWIFAMFGDEKVDVNVAGIQNNNFTFGLGGFKGDKILINSISEYFKKLESEIILDYDARKQKIHEFAKINKNDEDLLDEVTALVEWPAAVVCEYSKDFLKLPEIVIYTVLKNHQKCFAIRGEAKFVAICNGKNKNLELIKQGYEKVAIARLNDAMFFYEKDLKIPLRERTKGLQKLVYQEKLGSVYDKLARIKNIADKIEKSDKITMIIELCKNDLLTEMVYEFPELQGIMGKIYAEKTGEKSDVAQAIEDHYLPKFVGDCLPKTNEGAIVSIADKIDNIISTFKMGKKPTGSKDPFGIRRQIYGIFNILEAKKFCFDVFELFNIVIPNDKDNELRDFFNQRLENWFVDQGIRIDVSRSVLFDKSKCLPVKNLEKAKFIMQNIEEKKFLDVIALFKRANNILKNVDTAKIKNLKIDESSFEKQEEKLLFDYVKNLKYENDYSKFVNSFLEGKDLIANFFENVMVMDEDEIKRNNRLKILQMLIENVLEFADLSEIVVE